MPHDLRIEAQRKTYGHQYHVRKHTHTGDSVTGDDFVFCNGFQASLTFMPLK